MLEALLWYPDPQEAFVLTMLAAAILIAAYWIGEL